MRIGDIFMKIKKILTFQKADEKSFYIKEDMNFNVNAFKNRVWYRGKAVELQQLYEQLPNRTLKFWGSTSTKGLEVRRAHTGLPAKIVDTLVNIIVGDLTNMEIADNEEVNLLWEDIEEENKFKNIITKAVKDVLVVGDGAFKLSLDSELSDKPIIEFYGGDRIEVVYSRGRLNGIKFYTPYEHKGLTYTLEEYYQKGQITYKLFRDEKEVSLSMLEETADLQDVVIKGAENTIFATYLKVYDSEEYLDRGQSIFDGKDDNFDGLDEIWSQWLEAIRKNRPKTYIPDNLIPRNAENGQLLRVNPFDNQFITIDSDLRENAQNRVVTEQTDIKVDTYETSYNTAIDLCLQGIISPSTLGIDLKRKDNAEAQREKEKTTLYTRNKIIEALRPALEEFIIKTLDLYYLSDGHTAPQLDVNITFGEYATPSFDTVLETLSNPNAPLSIEAKVEELWGDTKDDDWKAEEVIRLKEEMGIVSMNIPSLADEVNYEGEELQ